MKPLTLITGGSRGIGAATARLCAQQGHAVAINYARDEAAASALVDELRAAGATAVALQGDVSNEADVMRLFAGVDALGPLTGLVNNAGIVDVAQRVEEMSVQRWTRMFGINVIGSMLCAREAVKRMSTRHGEARFKAAGGCRGGSIVNLGSAASRLGSPAQYVDYAATKGAIDVFTLGLAREVAAEGVRVNAVRPGVIDTDIHARGGQPERARELAPSIPMQRPGRADEVAQAIVWLLSAAASYTTGALIDVSGGR
jgi:NAD(P)-dependent dehydrogenase (short-subunit alcohol dehydrogenase family)